MSPIQSNIVFVLGRFSPRTASEWAGRIRQRQSRHRPPDDGLVSLLDGRKGEKERDKKVEHILEFEFEIDFPLHSCVLFFLSALT